MNEKRRYERPHGDILIVEDSPTQAEQLRYLLAQHEFVPSVAANGKEALAFLEQHLPDLVITDIVMPEMDGYELVRRIKGDARTRPIPVMMLTALSSPRDVLMGLQCGADNFVTKPYDEDYLLSRIRYIFANRELRQMQQMELGIQVSFDGEHYFITSERQQILDMLLSSYETAVQKNIELVATQDELRNLNEALGQRVRERTAELEKSEGALRESNRALRAVSLCNEVLIHATDEHEMVQKICEIIHAEAGYDLVWVGYAVPGAAMGVEACCGNPALCVTVEDAPADKAFRRGEAVVIKDVLSEPPSRWRDDLLGKGFRSAFALPLHAQEVFGVLSIYAAQPEAFCEEEIRLLSELAGDMSYGVTTLRTQAERERLERQQEATEQKLKSAMLGTIQTMSRTIEQRDPYTAGHQGRVAKLAAAIAQEMELPDEQQEGIRLGGLIHDIGKIHVPAEILTKPSLLTKIEFEIVKTHPSVGADIVKDVEFPWPVAEMILQHHERLNGSGYPQGLKDNEIILEAKILAVADVVEAMSSHRPYRPGIGLDAALAEIEQNRGGLYDPAAVDACLRLFREKGYELGM